MKFTLAWLMDHLETTATLDDILYALTDLGLEVVEVLNPGDRLKEFTIGKVLKVMIEKESKKSPTQWAGRTEGNMGVIFNKHCEQLKDIVDILIQDAQGVSLFGNRVLDEELLDEIN